MQHTQIGGTSPGQIGGIFFKEPSPCSVAEDRRLAPEAY